MRRIGHSLPVLRAIGVISAVSLLISGVTFAALQSQQAIVKGNTIQTANANLLLSADTINYSSQLEGFNFKDLVPGGAPMPIYGNSVYLKNAGTTPLALKLSVAKPVTNPNAVDLSKVHVILTPNSGTPQNMLLQDLIASNATGGIALTAYPRFMPAQTAALTVQVMMETDAVSGPTAQISDVDLSFGAVAVN